ncbi:hypothetical protein K2X92_02265 [Candidatus Gracilibacteria bacterium]|nr:hypothetical protein [Candidatus Gracilibacteria bacterium]
MEKTNKYIIDILVSIVDNYGDMGFACEYIKKMQLAYPTEFQYVVWVDKIDIFECFVQQSGIDNITVTDTRDFGKLRKSAICVSMLHSPLPDLKFFLEKALILRIDYISLDEIWLQKNEQEHILSTQNRQIVELIPSPIQSGAGLIPIFSSQTNTGIYNSPHITIFLYEDTTQNIDFDSFPEDITVYIFTNQVFTQKNIMTLDFLSLDEFYNLIDTSEFVIIRGEVSFGHVVQSSVPFFWDMYKGIGGFPEEQSIQFLDLIGANDGYRELHNILNSQKIGKLTYQNMKEVLSDTGFGIFQIKSLIHTVKKYIDRFNNSI